MTRSSLSFAATLLLLSIGCAANQGGRAPIPAPSQASDYQPPNALAPRDTGLLGDPYSGRLRATRIAWSSKTCWCSPRRRRSRCP